MTATPPMDPMRWRAMDAILQRALELAPAERDAWVAGACVGDAMLLGEVRAMLAAHDAAGEHFLERPPLAEAARPLVLVPPVERLARALEGRYRIERELAHGGTATVYLARDLRHDRPVALKVLREDLAAAVGTERFLAEIRVTAALHHPGILPLFDSGVADGMPWYAMPWVEGQSLRARLARVGTLPVDEAVRYAREVADALDHAHRHGVVHRDLKPENILLRDGHAVVADFGIALALDQGGSDRLTRSGVALGTPQYMAPEQAGDAHRVDARADVYALGAVLHEMLGGAAPPSPVALAMRGRPALDEAYREAGVYAPALAATVHQALRADPRERHASAADFRVALDAAMASPGPVASFGEPDAGAPRRRGVPARLVAWVALAMLATGFAAGWLASRPSMFGRLTSAAGNATMPEAAQRLLGEPEGGVLSVVDRTGRAQVTFDAGRPWAPRFSPDGHRLAYGAFDGTRHTSDLYVTDLQGGVTLRLTDDDRDANDPQWSPDGTRLVYSVGANGGKDLELRPLAERTVTTLAARPGTQYPTDWLRDGSALLVTEDVEGSPARDIVVQPTDGSPAHAWLATPADESAARISPDGRWVAYTSNASGREEVYLDAYPTRGQRVKLSSDGGIHPVWRADGRELFYWKGSALMAVQLGPGGNGPPKVRGESELFRMAYPGGANTLYDVSPDGQRFAIVRER